MSKVTIAATPMYIDGSTGDTETKDFDVDLAQGSLTRDHIAVGEFILTETERYVDLTHGDDNMRCDALDVTVTVESS